MSQTATCPFCKSKREKYQPECGIFFECGSLWNDSELDRMEERTPLCIEREARQKAEAELKRYQDRVERLTFVLEENNHFKERLVHTESELVRLQNLIVKSRLEEKRVDTLEGSSLRDKGETRLFSVDEGIRQKQLTKLMQDLAGKARLLADAEAQNQKLRSLLERATSSLIKITYGEPTIDFEWQHEKEQATELRKELEAL